MAIKKQNLKKFKSLLSKDVKIYKFEVEWAQTRIHS